MNVTMVTILTGMVAVLLVRKKLVGTVLVVHQLLRTPAPLLVVIFTFKQPSNVMMETLSTEMDAAVPALSKQTGNARTPVLLNTRVPARSVVTVKS